MYTSICPKRYKSGCYIKDIQYTVWLKIKMYALWYKLLQPLLNIVSL